MEGKRTVGVGVDYSPTSKIAVKWVVDNVVTAGDRVILVHAVHGKIEEHSQKQLWENEGSPLVPLGEFRDPKVQAHYDVHADPEVLDILDAASREKGVIVLAKIYWGDPREVLCDSVKTLKLDHLVVGSRGLGMIKRLWLGSVSHHVVNHVECPVTVVKTQKLH